jgi:hypothetical protein
VAGGRPAAPREPLAGRRHPGGQPLAAARRRHRPPPAGPEGQGPPPPAAEPAIQSRPPVVEPEERAPRPYTPALEAVSAAAAGPPTATAPLFDEIDTTADPLDAPWDDDLDDDPPPIPEKTYKPVSKASRPPRNDQDELPFDLDD